MKNILITGAGGYIGCTMVEQFLIQGHRVTGVDQFYFGKKTLGSDIISNKRFVLLQRDIRELSPDDLRGMDVVIDLAGLSNDATCDLKPDLTYSINFRGAINVAECAKKAKVPRFIYSSSCSVYGQGTGRQLRETSQVNPQSYYAKCKLDVERRVFELGDSSFCVTVLRNSTVYGLSKRMRFDLMLNVMTMKAWKDRRISILGGGEQWRPLVHVKDVVQGFELIMNAPNQKVAGEIFNLGSNEQNYQVFQIANVIKEILPDVEVIQVPDEPDKRTYNVNFDKINGLGFRAQFTVRDGIKEILEALKYGVLDPDDPRTRTIEHYRDLMLVDGGTE
jgi:nucleoside-diphosphate-sugar epimerase